VSGKDLSIIFAKPASLLVKYDIPGDQSTAELKLSLRTSELPGWDLGSGEFSTTVTNGGQVLLNLSPGTYDFYRFKNLKADDAERGIPFERRTVLLESGQTQEISLVRSVGSRVQGRIKDIDQTPAKSGYLYVRSAIATGEPRNHTEWLLPSFDALTFGSDGVFQTAQLEPGDYTLIAHVYTPEPPQLRYNTGIRLPAYWGTAKVRVAALVTPVSVEIDLRPTNTR
jgi:hypothetical protein